MDDVRTETRVIPERIQVETAFGCNASCTMCPVDLPTGRKKGVMRFETFKLFIDQMAPHRDHIGLVDLWGLGEPLLDKGLFDKVRYGHEAGFTQLAIATNGDLLAEDRIEELLRSGLETVIFSIDGIRAETHEVIRRNTDYANTIANIETLIRRRAETGARLKIVLRMIRQDDNRAEWPAFRDHWRAKLSREHEDTVIGYDVHTWGGSVDTPGGAMVEVPPDVACHHVYDRLIVLWDGTVALCCADMHLGEYALGNIHDTPAIDLFNSAAMRRYRMMHESGRREEMEICKRCTILQSEQAQQVT